MKHGIPGGGEAAVGADSSRPPPIYRPPRDYRINLLNPITNASPLNRPSRTTYQYYDDAHDTFMALPPYTSTREGMGSSSGGGGPNPCWRAFVL
jgi:hypothetical protein